MNVILSGLAIILLPCALADYTLEKCFQVHEHRFAVPSDSVHTIKSVFPFEIGPDVPATREYPMGIYATFFSTCGSADPLFQSETLEFAVDGGDTTNRTISIGFKDANDSYVFDTQCHTRFRRYDPFRYSSATTKSLALPCALSMIAGITHKRPALLLASLAAVPLVAGQTTTNAASTTTFTEVTTSAASTTQKVTTSPETTAAPLQCGRVVQIQRSRDADFRTCGVSWTVNQERVDVSSQCLIDGRPFVDANATHVSSTAVFDKAALTWNTACDHATAKADAAKAKQWTTQALGEHASVASFAAFSLQLMINGAPPQLLTAASVAAADEVRHAEQSFALASMFSGQTVGPSAFPKASIESMKSQTLQELAIAAFKEGCVAETISVIRAARRYDELNASAPPNEMTQRELRVLRDIVADELRHSALAWRTVAWASGVDASASKSIEATMKSAMSALSADNSRLRNALFQPLYELTVARNDWRVVVATADKQFPAQFESLETVAIQTLLDTFQ